MLIHQQTERCWTKQEYILPKQNKQINKIRREGNGAQSERERTRKRARDWDLGLQDEVKEERGKPELDIIQSFEESNHN